MEAIPRDKLCRAAVVSQYDEALSMALDFDFLAVKNDRPEDGVSRTIRLGLDALGMWTPPCSWWRISPA